ncbi:MAG: glycosyltransferase [Acetobacteraceae bacterium]|nr:glycosyltransferase [Acetobacteraceae bacterium]
MAGEQAPTRQYRIQRIITDRPTALRPLYWRAFGTRAPRADLLETGAIRIGKGTTVSFDTYFGAFFEQPWRLHTSLDDLALQASVEGPALLQVRRVNTLGQHLLHEQVVADESETELPIALEPEHHRQQGLLYFSLTALGGPVVLHRAAWVAASAPERTVGLAAVICTFNREADVARLLATLASDGEALRALSRVYVINQGRAGLMERPAIEAAATALGGRLRIIEQANLGGAGGFTRGLLAALDDAAITHAVLLDDDVRLEPESLPRMASFFGFSRADVPLGGHMLDALQPLRLFEAGAIVDSRNWSFQPQHHMVDLADPARLPHLAEGQAVHYSGWWCFGIPLSLVRSAGLPLPCFIRGDDLEYGIRLHQRGVYTVPLPGLAVWHEPFYIRVGSWQLYYETRNVLIAAALHFDSKPHETAERMAKQLLLHLLTFRYYSAALIVRGIEDFLQGPTILRRDPRSIHAGLLDLRETYGVATTSARAVLDYEHPTPLPRTWAGYRLALVKIMVRNWLAPTRDKPAKRMPVRDFAWITLARANHVALDTGWDLQLPTFRRSREHYRALLVAGFRAIFQLYRRAPAVNGEWREEAPHLTSEAFWRAYIRQVSPPPAAPPVTAEEDVTVAECDDRLLVAAK